MLRSSDLVGAVLNDRYELEAVIGEGTFGRVYRGRDRRLQRAVAVKVIKPWWCEDPEWVRSFEREAQLLARVSHPGIVQIYDVGQADGTLYYVAELVEGESLADRLTRGPLAPEDARQIAEQLCRALGHAHAKRVVHRDVKPANVLLSDGGLVKVGDFGVARLAEGTSDAAGGTVIGTPRYMAPEQADGGRTTPATDVYGVGVVLHEMLAGRPPFAGRSAVELALRHANDTPPRLPDETPDDLARVVATALAKDPRRRYLDGDAMAAALAPAGGARAAPRARARPAVLAASVARPAPDPLAVATVPLAHARTLVQPPPTVRTPRRVHGGRRTVVTFAAVAGVLAALIVGAVVLSLGPARVVVPRLTGLSSVQARKLLGSLGLRTRTATVPDPGTAPGTVTAQRPSAGGSTSEHGTVTLAVAEVPRWRPLTSFSGPGAIHSVPFRIRGEQWRVRYSMRYVGMCFFIFFCGGPTAVVTEPASGDVVARFSLADGSGHSRVLSTGPGIYEIEVRPGRDAESVGARVDDDY